MSLDPVSSFTPTLPVDLLSSSTGVSGATTPEKLRAACKAIEGLFAGQLLSEIGKTGVDDKDPAGSQYQDFIQQALAQQVTSGGGFGLAKMLEKELTPAAPHSPLTALHLHASTTPTVAK
jgi:Rod binding domain-containing protein